MKKLACMIALAFTSACAFSQQRTDVIPNEADSNIFYCYFSASYIFPTGKQDTFQKSRLRSDAINGNRLSKAEMEMVGFPFMKYDRKFHPHLLFGVKMITPGYLSSQFGFGISTQNSFSSSSVGVFYGTYYRRVTYESNFISRRKRSFENYNLAGFYLQSRSDQGSVSFSMAFEKTHIFVFTRAGFSVGEALSIGKSHSVYRSLELVLGFESLIGASAGLSVTVDRTRVEVFRFVPDPKDASEQARLQTEHVRGCGVSWSYYVN